MKNDLEAWSGFAIIASGCLLFQHATFLRGMDEAFQPVYLDLALADHGTCVGAIPDLLNRP